jgi:hypothetical protein
MVNKYEKKRRRGNQINMQMCVPIKTARFDIAIVVKE